MYQVFDLQHDILQDLEELRENYTSAVNSESSDFHTQLTQLA